MKRLTYWLLVFLIVCSGFSKSAVGYELEAIELFLVNVSSLNTIAFREKIRNAYQKKPRVKLRDVAALVALYEKAVGTGCLRGAEGTLKNVASFAQLSYEITAARFIALDYVLGSERANEILRKNSEALRNNYTLINNLMSTRSTRTNKDPSAYDVRDLIRALKEMAHDSPDADLNMVMPGILAGVQLEARPASPTTHRSQLVRVTPDEIEDVIRRFLGESPPSEDEILRLGALSEEALIQMLAWEAGALQAAKELDRRPRLLFPTLEAMVSHLRASPKLPNEVAQPLAAALSRGVGQTLASNFVAEGISERLLDCVVEILFPANTRRAAEFQ